MKKIISLLLILVMCIMPFQTAKAETTKHNINEITNEFLTIALENNEYFNLPNLQNKKIYISNPIRPYKIDENKLSKSNDIEYYFIKADDEYIACVTLCYENEEVVSSAINVDISDFLNEYNLNDKTFSLIASKGKLYLKTSEYVALVAGTTENNTSMRLNGIDETIEMLEESDVEFENLITNEYIYLTNNYTKASTRATTILNVPYVPQYDYPICWAASAGALGRFHTGISQYTALQLASIVGVGANGGTIYDSANVLQTVYKVKTTIQFGVMSTSQIIANIKAGRPILAHFFNASEGHAVVVCGYYEPEPGVNQNYFVRDSNFSSMQIIKHYGTNISIDYLAGSKMNWESALYKSSIE